MNEASGNTSAGLVAQGDGWIVEDVVCTRGPGDRLFEERHSHARIALVAAGTFQYRGESRSGMRRELMTPGSILLGNVGQCFECGHEHGTGDRCLSFGYAPDYFERLAADAGIRGSGPIFTALRLPPLRALSPITARAWSGLGGSGSVSWEEVGLRLAARTVQLARSVSPDSKSAPPSAAARVTRVIRRIEHDPDSGLTLNSLAREAGLSPYHFLRTFQSLTGVTPHQYILRTRLRTAAARIARETAKILDIALDCGFGDVSNFNHAFRAEFGVSPRIYRLQMRG